MTPIYAPAILSNVTDELATIAAGCQKFGLICTEKIEFDKYTAVIGIASMIIGMISLLLFQYFHRKTKEKLEKRDAK
jgi:hypothetical protein